MTVNNTKFIAGCAAIEVLLNNYLKDDGDTSDVTALKKYIDDYASINKALHNVGQFCTNDDERDTLNALVLRIKEDTIKKLSDSIDIISNSHLAIDITSTTPREDSRCVEIMNQYLIDAVNYCVNLANVRHELHRVKLEVNARELGARTLKLHEISDITNLYANYGFKDIKYDIKSRTFSGIVDVTIAKETIHTITRIPLTRDLARMSGVTNYDHRSKGGMLLKSMNSKTLNTKVTCNSTCTDGDIQMSPVTEVGDIVKQFAKDNHAIK